MAHCCQNSNLVLSFFKKYINPSSVGFFLDRLHHSVGFFNKR